MTETQSPTPTGQQHRPANSDHPIEIPPGDEPHVCAYCDTPFKQPDLLALHHGLEHGPRLTEAEYEAYESALAEENDEIRRFRIIALGGLVLLYFGFLFAYAIFAV